MELLEYLLRKITGPTSRERIFPERKERQLSVHRVPRLGCINMLCLPACQCSLFEERCIVPQSSIYRDTPTINQLLLLNKHCKRLTLSQRLKWIQECPNCEEQGSAQWRPAVRIPTLAVEDWLPLDNMLLYQICFGFCCVVCLSVCFCFSTQGFSV